MLTQNQKEELMTQKIAQNLVKKLEKSTSVFLATLILESTAEELEDFEDSSSYNCLTDRQKRHIIEARLRKLRRN